MPSVPGKCVHLRVCVSHVSPTTSWGVSDHACMCTHVCIFAFTTVCVCGRCEGFPSAYNKVLYSQWDATKRDRDKKERGDGFKKMKQERTVATKLFLKYTFKCFFFLFSPALTM